MNFIYVKLNMNVFPNFYLVYLIVHRELFAERWEADIFAQMDDFFE